MQIFRITISFSAFVLLVGNPVLNAQGSDIILSCYETLLQNGDQELSKGRYDKAIRQYWAAFDCELPEDHQLVERIQEVSKRWVAELEHQAEEARKSEQEARAAEEEAIQSKIKEEEAKVLAQQKAEEARKRGQQVEARRLSLLADKARADGESSTAIALSYLSLKMWPDDSLSSKMRAFSTAIRDSFEQAYLQPNTTIKTLLPQDEGVLSVSEEGAYFYPNETSVPQELPQAFTKARKITMAPDGESALLVFEENEVALWEKAKSNQLLKWKAHQGRIIGGEMLGQNAVTFSNDHTARLWKQSKDESLVLNGHEGTVYAVSFSPSGEFVVTRSSDGSLRIWDIEGNCKSVIRDEKGYIYNAQFSSDGMLLLVAGASGDATIWSLEGRQSQSLMHSGGAVIDAKFINDDEWVLTRDPRTAKVWRRDNGEILYESDVRLEGARWVPQKQVLLLWYYSGEIHIWEPVHNRTKKLTGHKGRIVDVQFAPMGNQLLSTSQDGTARLWDHLGNTLITWNLQSRNPIPAFFSQDSQLVYTVQEDNQVVNSCIIPSVALQHIEDHYSEWQSEFSSIREKYQLMFWEEK